jgi:hypothetical protein
VSGTTTGLNEQIDGFLIFLSGIKTVHAVQEPETNEALLAPTNLPAAHGTRFKGATPIF